MLLWVSKNLTLLLCLNSGLWTFWEYLWVTWKFIDNVIKTSSELVQLGVQPWIKNPLKINIVDITQIINSNSWKNEQIDLHELLIEL